MPLVAQAEVSLTGPTSPVEVGELYEVFVSGIPHEALPQTVIKWWPRENVQVRPAMTWAGEPFILLRSTTPGEFFLWVAILSDREVDYAEIVIDIGGDIPDPPDPEPIDLADYVLDLTEEVQSSSHSTIAGVFQDLSEEIGEGEFRGSSQILNTTSARMFTENVNKEWVDWFNTLAQYLLDTKLVTNKQWSEAYQVVATVLEGVGG